MEYSMVTLIFGSYALAGVVILAAGYAADRFSDWLDARWLRKHRGS